MVGREHREDHCPAIIPVGISGLDRGMSALPPKADMAQHRCDVRFVPEADSCTAAKSILIDSHVGFGPAA
jgi:hypothetical protein